MNPPAPDLGPEAAKRVSDTVELLAKVAGSALIVWGFIARVGKPYFDWRQRQRAESIRLVLKEELACIQSLSERDEQVTQKLDVVIARQTQVFDEIELFMVVMADNRDRIDELADLMNESGFASRDRREVTERRRASDEAMAELQGRLRMRRRHDDQVDELDGKDLRS